MTTNDSITSHGGQLPAAAMDGHMTSLRKPPDDFRFLPIRTLQNKMRCLYRKRDVLQVTLLPSHGRWGG